MKQFSFLFLLVCSLVASAQSPQGISYQAVATDVQGAPLDNQAIVVRFSILEAAPTGAAVYIETHNTSTDPYGMFNLNLGMGIHEGGSASSLAEVNWGLAAHFLKVELDIDGNGGFVSMGTQQMMSVPYALYAEQAGNAGDDQDQDQDPTNELQNLSLSGDTLSLSNGGEVVLNFGSESQSLIQFSIECVDMGISPLCGALGLSPNATLLPYDGAFKYQLSASTTLNSDNYINQPHWRKFQIHGISDLNVSSVVFRYFYRVGYSTNDTYYRPELSTREIEIDEDGNAFIYFYRTSSGCVGDGLGLVVPFENAFNAGAADLDGIEILLSNGHSLIGSGIYVDL